MKTRPHIVTQTTVICTDALCRSQRLIAERIGREGAAGRDAAMLRFCRFLIRVTKIVLAVTIANDCYKRRKAALETPESRRRLHEHLGGAPAIKKWRRLETWNKGREAAIADGSYCAQAPQAYTAAPRPKRVLKPATSGACNVKPVAAFRLPPQRDYLSTRPAPRAGLIRGAQAARFPCIVVWPHELDGQYVPGFQSRARQPGGGVNFAQAAFAGVKAENPAPPFRPPR